jgi:hypothetical protein
VVAYADTAGGGEPDTRVFAIEQLVAPGEVAARPLLPSFRYHPVPGELAPTDLQLPWTEPDLGEDLPFSIQGELARNLGAKVPGRLVASAKSWLSHAAVDRTAPILPWGGTEDIGKVSPLHTAAGYLAHVRAAWNQQFPRHRLERQDVVLTLPASFDEAARALTIEAARLAGLPGVRLLEEPQAACYDWLRRHHDMLETVLAGVRLLLVCDVGGGTTDLTLIQIEPGEAGPRLIRIGVGDHLMLGGDNMDLAIAHLAEQRLMAGGARLGAANLAQLMQQCRAAKERLLAPDAPDSAKVTLLGAGSRLIGGAKSVELSRDEIQSLVVDGFFPLIKAHEQPEKRRAAIVEFGLPYVADAAVSRHIAAFLAHHARAAREALGERAPAPDKLPMPDAVLLNGGVFHSRSLARRLLDTLANWRGAPLVELDNDDPDLAVARGAVAYAMARRGRGLRIGGGSARSYFLRIDDDRDGNRGVCLLPRGTEEGNEVRLDDRTFVLRLGQPVQFHLVSSTADTRYRPGQLLDLEPDDFTVLPPIATVLVAQSPEIDQLEVPVNLAAVLTEVGTLGISCIAADTPDQRWRLEFQLRGQEAGRVVTAAKPHPRFDDAAERIERLYGGRTKGVEAREIKALRNELEKILGRRDGWETPLLRELFAVIWDGARRRRRSADHERLWLNLAGFCLRPGFGYPLDGWRVQQLWGLYGQGVQYVRETQIWSEWWTLWRRVAGGLEASAQERILDDIGPELRPPSTGRKKQKGAPRKQGYDDMVRLVASLERLSAERKAEVGEWLLARLRGKGESPQSWWAVGRLGARMPFHGSAHNVVPREQVTDWLEQLLVLDWKKVQPVGFAAAMLARMSGDRERDLDQALRDRVAQRLRAVKAPESWMRMVQEVVELESADEKRVFGDSLPPGLRLLH